MSRGSSGETGNLKGDLEMYDLKLDHEELLLMSNDNILRALQLLYPKRKLYTISLGWRESKNYILKAKGTDGDVVVGWN